MIEKRHQPRYLPRQPMPVVAQVDGVLVRGLLGDISERGCLLLLPLAERQRCSTARRLMGEIDSELLDGPWEGDITHHSAIRCHHGVGVRFTRPQTEFVGALLRGHLVGGLQMRTSQQTTHASIFGHLGFHMNRPLLPLIRQRRVAHIDVSACTGLDSAGIGLLAIANDNNIGIAGAKGAVRHLLEMADLIGCKGIAQARR